MVAKGTLGSVPLVLEYLLGRGFILPEGTEILSNTDTDFSCQFPDGQYMGVHRCTFTWWRNRKLFELANQVHEDGPA